MFRRSTLALGIVALALSASLSPSSHAVESCGASWYGPGFEGRTTASGEPFDPNALTAAHRTLPFGTVIRVTHAGRSVDVRINDRGPFTSNRCLDLSRAAFDAVAPLSEGHISVTWEPVPIVTALSAPAVPEGFDEYITLYNPGTVPANVGMRYLLDGASPVTPGPIAVAAGTRATVNVADIVGRGREVSVEVTSDQPIAAERPMYFSFAGTTGGHVISGAAPSTEHYFPDGYTGAGFETYLVMANPGDAVDATITYLPESGPPVTTSVALPAQARVTVRQIDHVGPGVAASAIVTSPTPIAVERPMYYRYGGSIDGGHTIAGATEPATSAAFAEGRVGAGFDTYLVLMNPGTSAATVSAKLGTSAGPVVRSWDLPPRARRTVRLNDEVPVGDVAITLSSNHPIVAERTSYFDAEVPGVGRVTGGHASTARAGGSKRWYFAEGHTGDGFQEYVVVANPGTSLVTATVVFSANDGATWDATVVVAPGERRTVDATAVVGPGRDVSTRVGATQPVVVERPVYFRYHDVWDGGHSSGGSAELSTSFLFAEGFTR